MLIIFFHCLKIQFKKTKYSFIHLFLFDIQFNDNFDEQINIGNQYQQDLFDHEILTILSSSLDNLWLFVERIPGFHELNELDRKTLFQNSCLELFALRLAYR